MPTRDERTVAMEQANAYGVIRAVLDGLPNFVFAKDRAGRYTIVNRSHAEAYGSTPEEMLGRTQAELGAPPGKAKEWMESDRQAMDNLTEVFIAEEKFVDAQGRVRWLQSHKSPIIDSDGVARQVLVIATDVTARRSEQLALAQLAAIVNSSTEAMMSADANGVITSWNPASERLYGYSRDEALGQHFSMLQPPGSTQLAAIIEMMKRGERVDDVQGTRMRKDGTLVEISLTLFPLRNVEGEIIGTSAIARDVSELRRANERLRQSEAQLADAQRVGRIGSWWKDLATGSLTWSEETFRQLGYDPLTDRPSHEAFLHRVHPEDRVKTMAAIESGTAAGTPFSYRVRYILPNGEERVSNAHAQVVKDDHGRPLRLVGTTQDITAEATAEMKLEQRLVELNAEKEAHREARALAETANSAKSDFLANMSHELRTPLNSVIGFSDILLKNRAKNLTGKDLDYVNRIQANGRHLLALINSVLDLSKVEAGHMELDITSVPLGDLVTETLEEIQPQASARGVTLLADIPDAALLLETDRAKLKQIIINLVGNAVKFSAQREVRVILRADPVSGRPIAIEVADTGIGIPTDRMDAIFEAFQQADNSTTRQFVGTGLGLTISRSLALLMGFDLTVASEVGVGSTFTIALAPHHADMPSVTSTGMIRDVTSAIADLSARADGRLLVLVIDDESDARVILRRSFEDLGCCVVTAATAEEGMALARTVSPGMITIDLMMPRRSGWEALRELQLDPVLRSIPVVVVSAVASENRMHLFGALDYLDKPVTREQLARVIGRHKTTHPETWRRTA
ncbi:MAG: PAS domain S-box protein [bacterium]